MVKKKLTKKVVIIPDLHTPFHDKKALAKVYSYIKDVNPDKVIFMGDVMDCYALSRFSKNPERINSLQEEVDSAREIFSDLRSFYKGQVIYLEGNHEHRLLRYLWDKAPEMSSLKSISSIPELLGLRDFGVQYKTLYSVSGVLFKHGHLVRQQSAYTAKGELEAEGTSGVSGHTHRLGSHFRTNRGGAHAWFEVGHLCDENASEYMEGKVPNWQKGFAIMNYVQGSQWSVDLIPVVNGRFIVNGKVYS